MWIARLLVIFGWTLIGLSAAHLPAIVVAVANGENLVVQAMVASALICSFVGLGMIVGLRGAKPVHDRRVAMFIPIALWAVLPLFGALPLYLSGFFPSYGAAYFEAISGMTTTGASILPDPAALPRGVLMWRSFLEWIGGLGVVIIAATIFTRINIGGYRIVQTWLPTGEGETVGGQLRGAFEALLPVYLVITTVCWGLLWASGENVYDALNLSLSTVSTGGFSAYSDSVAVRGNPLAQTILVVFMIIGATGLTLHRKAFNERRLVYRGNAEFMAYLKILVLVAISLTAISLVLRAIQGNGSDITSDIANIGNAIFMAVSMITTTGYLPDGMQGSGGFGGGFGGGGMLALGVIAMGLVVVGGTTASTSGGIKVMRAMLLFRHIRQELRRLPFPNISAPILHQDRQITDDDMSGVWFLFLTIMLAIGLGTLLLAISGLSFSDALSTAVAASTNAGPAANAMAPGFVGYASMSGLSQTIIVILMVLGRVEGALLLAIFARTFWGRD